MLRFHRNTSCARPSKRTRKIPLFQVKKQKGLLIYFRQTVHVRALGLEEEEAPFGRKCGSIRLNLWTGFDFILSLKECFVGRCFVAGALLCQLPSTVVRKWLLRVLCANCCITATSISSCQSGHQTFGILMSCHWHAATLFETAVLFKYMWIIFACSSVSIYLLPLPQVTQEDWRGLCVILMSIPQRTSGINWKGFVLSGLEVTAVFILLSRFSHTHTHVEYQIPLNPSGS